MLSSSWFPFSGLFSFWRGSSQVFSIPSAKIHEIETAHEKPARALKHLLKLNHANHAILYNRRKFHNHAPHVSIISVRRLSRLVASVLTGRRS